eukprot:scaffold156051_cov46-Cyclotella_meneghiniana.AAC.2
MFSLHVTPRKKSAQKLSEALSSSAKYHEQTKQNRSSSNLTSTKKSTTKQSDIESSKKYHEQKKSLSSSKSKFNINKPKERQNHAKKVTGTEKRLTDSSPAKSTRSQKKRLAPDSSDVGDESKGGKKKPPRKIGNVSRSDQC